MGSLSVKIGANTADLEKNIDRAKKILEKYSQTAHQAKSEIEQNVSISNQQANAYQRVVKQLEKVNSGTLATTQQQKVLSNQVKELKIQWNALTDDQKISGFGQSIAQSLKAAESELETTKQKLADVNTGASNIKPIDGKSITEGFTQELDGLKNKVVSLGAEGSGALAPLVSTFSDLGPYGMAAAAGIAAIAGASQLGIEAATTFSQDAHDQIDQMKAAWDGAVTSLSVYIEQTLHLGETITSVGNTILDVLTPLTGQTAELVNAERQYTAAQDDLGDKLDLVTIREKALKEAITEKNEILKDPKATQEAIDAANKKAENALANYQKEVDGANTANTKVLNSIINRHAAVQHYEKMNSAAVQYILDNLSHEEMKEQAKKFNYMIKNRSKFTAEQQAIIEASHMWTQSLNDKQRKDYLSHLTKMLDLDKIYFRSKKQLETGSDFDVNIGGNDDKGKGKVKSSFKVSTPKVKDKTLIQQLEETNNKLQKEYDYRVKNYNKLSELVQKQKELNDQIAKQKELELLNTKALDKKTLAQAGGAKVVKSASEGIKDVDKDIKKFSKDLGNRLKPQIKDISSGWKEAQKNTMTQQEAIKSLGQSAGVMGQAFSEAFGEASGAAKAFIAVERVMLVAEQAIATAGAIKLAVESSKHWIEAIAASAALVAQVVSMFSTISKFEGGGIVNSASKTGDRNIIRVNGDEMILNQRQQAHLFKMLDDPYVSHTPNISYMQPEVKIKGSDIYLSQKNYKAITGRKI